MTVTSQQMSKRYGGWVHFGVIVVMQSGKYEVLEYRDGVGKSKELYRIPPGVVYTLSNNRMKRVFY